METITFQDVWQLLQPTRTFDTRARYEKCLAYWNSKDQAQQMRIYQRLADKRQREEFINPNPYFALDDTAQEDEYAQAKQRPRQQTLSFSEYYAKYGTTEETDGWRRVFQPEKQTTIFVKCTT